MESEGGGGGGGGGESGGILGGPGADLVEKGVGVRFIPLPLYPDFNLKLQKLNTVGSTCPLPYFDQNLDIFLNVKCMQWPTFRKSRPHTLDIPGIASE